MKPALRAHSTKRLQLEHDKLFSSFAFNFNLCPYTKHVCRARDLPTGAGEEPVTVPVLAGRIQRMTPATHVIQRSITPSCIDLFFLLTFS